VLFEVNTTSRFTPNDGREPSKESKESDGGEGGETRQPPTDKASSGDDDAPVPPSRRPLPKPEVKTAVHVRREGRSPRSARGSREGT
jgi:hypothetical protein